MRYLRSLASISLSPLVLESPMTPVVMAPMLVQQAYQLSGEAELL
jgi:hypothetical protein